jgi:predicted regulator of Ras-like GTPase activity (Roadblock/LC7/MglB family)
MSTSHTHHAEDVPQNLHFYEDQIQVIEKIVNHLLVSCPASFALVTQTTGEIVWTEGETRPESVETLAAVVAGSIVTSQAVAHMMGERQSEYLLVHEGQQTSYLTQTAGEHLILFVQVDCQVPLGWARLAVQLASRQIAEVISAAAPAPQVHDLLPPDFAGQVVDDLNALWLE